MLCLLPAAGLGSATFACWQQVRHAGAGAFGAWQSTFAGKGALKDGRLECGIPVHNAPNARTVPKLHMHAAASRLCPAADEMAQVESFPIRTAPQAKLSKPSFCALLIADEMARVKNYLVRTGLCNEVHHKEQYVPQKQLEGALLVLLGCIGVAKWLSGTTRSRMCRKSSWRVRSEFRLQCSCCGWGCGAPQGAVRATKAAGGCAFTCTACQGGGGSEAGANRWVGATASCHPMHSTSCLQRGGGGFRRR